MASINNISIKSLKHFKGMEGDCFQGNIYFKNKLLGFWSQDSWGGGDNYEFNQKLLDEPLKNYLESLPDNYKYKSVETLDSLIANIIELSSLEKDYKKHLKANRNVMIILTAGFKYTQIGLLNTTIDEKEAKSKRDARLSILYSELINKQKEGLIKEGYLDKDIRVDIFSSLKDFDVVTDMYHQAPKMFLIY